MIFLGRFNKGIIFDRASICGAVARLSDLPAVFCLFFDIIRTRYKFSAPQGVFFRIRI